MNETLKQLQQQWLNLSKRDQQACLMLSAAIIVGLIIFAVILPIKQSLTTAQAEYLKAQKTLAELTQLAPAALANTGRQNITRDTTTLNTEVRRQAARNGLTIQRFEPNGNLLSISLEDVQYRSVILFLGGLESLGIIQYELVLEDRPKPGLISVRATLGFA